MPVIRLEHSDFSYTPRPYESPEEKKVKCSEKTLVLQI